MKWAFVLGGLLCLFVSSYLDNARGPLMPVISRTLELSYSRVSLFLVVGNIAAVVGMFLMVPIAKRLNEKRLTLLLLLLGAGGILATSQATHFARLLVLAGFLGTTIATIGALSNILVMAGTTLTMRSRFFCALHLMYGMGSLLAPFLVGGMLLKGYGWSTTLTLGAAMLAALALFVGVRFQDKRMIEPPEDGRYWVKGGTYIIVLFSVYVAAETLSSMWMVTYLVENLKLDVQTAGKYLSGYFLVLSAMRFFCFVGIKPQWERPLLMGSVALALLFFILGHLGQPWAFCFTGFLGPFFPLLLARVTHFFPRQASTLTLWVLTSVQLTMACLHFFVGQLTDHLGISRSYLLPVPLMILVLIGLPSYFRIEKSSISEHATT